jgi:hypothetical protein
VNDYTSSETGRKAPSAVAKLGQKRARKAKRTSITHDMWTFFTLALSLLLKVNVAILSSVCCGEAVGQVPRVG